jgi:uncharacterized protein YacL
MGVLGMVLEELLGHIRGYTHVLEAAAILVVALLIAILASRYFRSKALARLSVEIVNLLSRFIFISILFIGLVLALKLWASQLRQRYQASYPACYST